MYTLSVKLCASAVCCWFDQITAAPGRTSDYHSKSDYKESTLKGILNAIKAADLPVSSVNADSTKYTGYTSTLTGYIRDVFPDVPVNYVWSDHDRYALQEDDSTLLDNESGLVYGAGGDGLYGTDDDGNYYIYSLSMADLSTNNRYDADFHSDAEVTATKVFPHNLRKLFARTVYALSRDLAQLADILGHSSINTTRIYIMSTGAEHRRRIERMRLVVP